MIQTELKCVGTYSKICFNLPIFALALVRYKLKNSNANKIIVMYFINIIGHCLQTGA